MIRVVRPRARPDSKRMTVLRRTATTFVSIAVLVALSVLTVSDVPRPRVKDVIVRGGEKIRAAVVSRLHQGAPTIVLYFL